MQAHADASIHVLIASPEVLLCDAVKLSLDREHDLAVVAESRGIPEAIDAARRTQAHVVVLDTRMPDRTSDVVALFRERMPTCRLVVLADGGDDRVLADALEAGANGLATKHGSLPELIAAVRSVHRGESFVPQPMLGRLIGELVRRRKERDDALLRTARLTPREREVLGLLAQGVDTNGIARSLVISPETARTHIQNVLCKLGVHSRLEAAALIANTDILEELAAAGPVSVPRVEGA